MNENIIVKTATTATYGGSATAIIFGLTANEFAALGGLFIGVVGLIITTWYKHQHLKIAKESFKADAKE
jgi:uncharacterized membrane protein